MPVPKVCLTWHGVLRGAGKLASLSVFVIPFGIAYGVAAVGAGMTIAQTITASVLTFSGAAQFSALDLWGTDVSLLALGLLTLAVSARHVVMGAALSPWVNQLDTKTRVLSAAFLSDPNFAYTHDALKRDERDIGVLIGGGAIGWAAWVIGTAIGATGGSLIGDPAAYGIDSLMPVYFAALVAPRIIASTRWAFVGVAALVTIVFEPLLPGGWNVILAALAGGAVGLVTQNG